MNQRLVALHGFAGLPSDWDSFENSFRDWPLYKLNLFVSQPLSFNDWATATAKDLNSFEGRQVLLGYSLGARLGAHLLLRAPKLFAGAIFVSGNPGLADESERLARRHTDDLWAAKWRAAPWSSLQAEWSAQAVFQSPYSQPLPRRENEFDRVTLASAMRRWSLAEQSDLRTELAQVRTPQLWLAGADDQKFVKLAAEMSQLSKQIHFEALPKAGHRAPWDNPAAFVASVTAFLESL